MSRDLFSDPADFEKDCERLIDQLSRHLSENLERAIENFSPECSPGAVIAAEDEGGGLP